jgi:hypothetical protein
VLTIIAYLHYTYSTSDNTHNPIRFKIKAERVAKRREGEKDCPLMGENKDLQMKILEEKQGRARVVFLCDTSARKAAKMPPDHFGVSMERAQAGAWGSLQ